MSEPSGEDDREAIPRKGIGGEGVRGLREDPARQGLPDGAGPVRLPEDQDERRGEKESPRYQVLEGIEDGKEDDRNGGFFTHRAGERRRHRQSGSRSGSSAARRLCLFPHP